QVGAHPEARLGVDVAVALLDVAVGDLARPPAAEAPKEAVVPLRGVALRQVAGGIRLLAGPRAPPGQHLLAVVASARGAQPPAVRVDVAARAVERATPIAELGVLPAHWLDVAGVAGVPRAYAIKGAGERRTRREHHRNEEEAPGRPPAASQENPGHAASRSS